MNRYQPLEQVSLVLTRGEVDAKCARLNDKYPHMHFKRRRAGSGWQVVAAKRDGSLPTEDEVCHSTPAEARQIVQDLSTQA